MRSMLGRRALAESRARACGARAAVRHEELAVAGKRGLPRGRAPGFMCNAAAEFLSRLPIICGWCPLHPHHIFTARCGRHWPGCKVSPVRVSLVGRAGESTSEVCDVRRGSSGSLQDITPTVSAAPDILVWPTSSSDLPLQPPQPPQTSSSTGQYLPPTPSHSLSRLRKLPRPPNLPRQLNHPWSRSLSGVAC